MRKTQLGSGGSISLGVLVHIKLMTSKEEKERIFPHQKSSLPARREKLSLEAGLLVLWAP